MHAVLWSDYICPWCYLGQDRTAWLETLGVSVTARPFELHPSLPAEGVRSERKYSRIAAACAEIGLPFTAPTHVPNSRRALLTAEYVRIHAPASFATLDRALFTAYFVDGRNIGDPAVLDELVAHSGAGPVVLDDDLLTASMNEAYDAGVSATPAWFIDDRLVIPGVQDRSYYERMVTKLGSEGNSPH